MHRFSAFVSTRGKHEVKQSDREDISNMNSAYLVPKFTLLQTWVATPVSAMCQPPPPVSTQGPPQVIHRLHTGAELSTGTQKLSTRGNTRQTRASV